MRVSRGIAAILCAAPLAACAVVGPELDRAMDDAPSLACAEASGFLILAPGSRSRAARLTIRRSAERPSTTGRIANCALLTKTPF